MRRRHLMVLALATAVSAASLGLVVAQETGSQPPPVPIPSTAPPPGDPPPAVPAEGVPADALEPPPTVTLPIGAAPPEEAELPAEAVAEAAAPPEPAPPEPAARPDPLKRPRYASAILQAVDKVTAETLRFEAKVGEPVRFKGLVMTVHACEGAASDEGFSDAIAHVDVQAQSEARARQSRVVFRGWMFASSPALHPVEHPLYDVWLIACRTPAPVVPGGKT